MTLADLGREIRLSGPVFSPDGKKIAFLTRRADYVDNRWVKSLILIDVASGDARELVPHRPKISAPRWAPDGKCLAYLDAEDKGKSQIYVLCLNPKAASSTRITNMSQGVRAYRWSPDGTRFAVLTPDAPAKLSGEQAHNKSFEVGDNSFLDQKASISSHI